MASVTDENRLSLNIKGKDKPHTNQKSKSFRQVMEFSGGRRILDQQPQNRGCDDHGPKLDINFYKERAYKYEG